jgi:probable rRNA maturation factor
MLQVVFNFNDVSITLKNRKVLKKFITVMFKREHTPFEYVGITFCSDKFLRTMNIDYLKHDYNTDIITFSLQEPGKPVVGDIYISCDTVRINAFDNKVTFTNELHRVVFHGVLHLCGYNDKTRKELALMRSKEDYYLNHYFK